MIISVDAEHHVIRDLHEINEFLQSELINYIIKYTHIDCIEEHSMYWVGFLWLNIDSSR
jgi:hypothetical protein